MPLVEPQPAPVPAEADVAGTVEAADEALALRFAALGRFTRTVSQYVTTTEAPALAGAAQLVQRAQERLRFGERWPGTGRLGGHTVVALAGATGVGKSSLFNALAGMTLSPPGHLRPTTGEAHACVWEARGAADDLLDWLGVSENRRFVRESELDEVRKAMHDVQRTSADLSSSLDKPLMTEKPPAASAGPLSLPAPEPEPAPAEAKPKRKPAAKTARAKTPTTPKAKSAPRKPRKPKGGTS